MVTRVCVCVCGCAVTCVQRGGAWAVAHCGALTGFNAACVTTLIHQTERRLARLLPANRAALLALEASQRRDWLLFPRLSLPQQMPVLGSAAFPAIITHIASVLRVRDHGHAHLLKLAPSLRADVVLGDVERGELAPSTDAKCPRQGGRAVVADTVAFDDEVRKRPVHS